VGLPGRGNCVLPGSWCFAFGDDVEVTAVQLI